MPGASTKKKLKNLRKTFPSIYLLTCNKQQVYKLSVFKNV